jgi:hypothetical protein
LVDALALFVELFVNNLPWMILVTLFPPAFPLAILIQEPQNLALITSAFGL